MIVLARLARTARAFALLLALLLLPPLSVPSPAHAQEKVDLALALMVDASGSIDQDEFLLQRMGYVRAFRNPRVLNAIRSGPLGKIAVTYVEWTGAFLQVPVAPWTLLSDPASVENFAQILESVPRQLFTGGTAVGHAILYGARTIEASGFQAARRVIDVSGDGPTNRGIPAEFARDQVVAQGFTVNGLPILNSYEALEVYFLDHVIGGPGAFSIPARGFEDFNAAILTKLIREIADLDEAGAIQAVSLKDWELPAGR